MDKCREEFEKQKYWIGLFRADVDFDMTLGKFGRYVSNGSRRIDAMYLESFNEKWEAWANAWQHQQAKVEELQKRLDGALKETQYALQYVEEDMRGNHEFLQMAMIRAFKELEKVLNGGEPK
ncbi:hypothetical protein Q4010_04590 [Acinetobacter baumannii]|uniref:hypothetical protein n=2 Tax=Acinetobacter baumannii TaxID=470 RepID=UPI001FEE38F5|nr:hypothetical protein [Acinetobacter baumannii]MCF4373649.1 hypothetical protein [Acinetobacter baumannii]MCP8518059.1 hypothetical protein [Acinetobacter baumannii]MCZ3024552.1 hypothetical protein [Acinetobacter baumannii]MCZ3137163.1 hypothetical protein [Acinetobacter baumannii]MCZ3167851.1 hypothetical protein [Acinetobacter baumannii]